MLKRFLLLTAIVLAGFSFAFAQSGTLKGKITDSKTKEAISFANVVLEVGGKMIGGATTDIDGNFTIKPIPPGKYDLKSTYVGYKPLMIKGIVISADKIAFQNLDLESSVEILTVFDVKEYKVPLIQQDQTSSGQTMTSDEISKMATRGANSVAVATGGVFSQDGQMGSVRGSRAEGTVTYIDGVRVRGSANVPQSSIDQVSMIVGGTPAQYGDATGGVLNITTKGASNKFGGGIEILTSQFLDAFKYNLLGFNFQGPILRDSAKTTSKIGFFIGGEFTSELDPDPSNIGVYRIKKDRLDALKNDIFKVNSSGNPIYSAKYFTKNDFENVKIKDNTKSIAADVTAKLDFRLSKTANLTVGGSYNYVDQNLYSYANSLFNYENNPKYKESTARGFVRFTQRFGNSENTKALLKNVFYTIQVDYTKNISEVGDEKHWDNLFNYGYVGQFDTKGYKNYVRSVGDTLKEYYKPVANFDPLNPKYDTIRPNGSINYIHYYYSGQNRQTGLIYTPSNLNPDLALYNTELYNTFPGMIITSNDLLLRSGLLNGTDLPNLYTFPNEISTGVVNQYGNKSDLYRKINNDQFSVNGNFSADLGEHEIKFGFLYEQRKDRMIQYRPSGLWDLMRQSVNSHREGIEQTYSDYHFNGDTLYVDFNHLYDFQSESYFSYNLRKELGFNSTEWVDLDSLSPDVMKIDWFSPDQLFNSTGFTSSYVNYYGYDYTGKVQNSKPSFDDFFTKTENTLSYNTISPLTGRDTTLYKSMYSRPIGAYEPNYMAFYIQDKFSFNDLIFNIGLRVDRFDANQMVLKDPYNVIPLHTVGSARSKGYTFTNIPGNIKDDFTVYVNESGTEIEAFRDGDVWYDKTGAVISEQTMLKENIQYNGIQVDPTQKDVNSSAFEDYDPKINFLPRIAFSFPVSDEANFFAHYDVLSNRPYTGIRLNVMDYYFIKNVGTNVINNPSLTPEMTREYELGFQQKLGKTSAIKASIYYKELKDQIAMWRFTGAYPSSYISYKNLDFGTVKGLTVAYDLRRTGNVWLKATYTMQFADGTGSDPNAAYGLIRAGQSSLRTTTPLAYDRRHSITGIIDYRYADGSEYNGPGNGSTTTFGKIMKGFFQNLGANAQVTSGSGIPYTAKVFQGNAQGAINSGSLFGSRMPWNVRVDLKIDKDIVIKFGKTKKKETYLNLYVQVLNVLNTVNILNVYPTTGNANDDGYLSAPEAQSDINSQISVQAFKDIRTMYIDSPDNYSLPRRVRLGISYSF